MNPEFREAVESLHPKYEALLPHHGAAKLPAKGVYVFYENGEAFYVGRSNDIRRRLGDHRNLSSGTNKAAFARLMACKELGIPTNYGPGRDKCKSYPGFDEAFLRAKRRVAAMEFRAVGEENPTYQALLEIYCAMATRAKFNSFDNH
jgi:hypothetical protein